MEIFVESRKIPSSHMQNVCKYRQGAITCRYIVFKNDHFYCVKNVPEIQDQINGIKDMKAKGNNCQGL